MNTILPPGIYDQEIGCTLYPNCSSFPKDMQKKLKDAVLQIHHTLPEIDFEFPNEKIDRNGKINHILSIYGNQILNLHFSPAVDPIFHEITWERLNILKNCIFIQKLDLIKFVIALGADVNAIGSTNNARITALSFAASVTPKNCSHQIRLEIAVYIKACGGIEYPKISDPLHRDFLNQVDKILFEKQILLLAGNCDGNSSLRYLQKDIIMFINNLFLDCLRKDIK